MSVTIFGILNIGLSILNLFSLVAVPVIKEHVNTPVNPAYDQWLKISHVVTGGNTAMLVAAGLGLLYLQNWARILSIIYSVIAIASSIVYAVVYVPVLKSMVAQSMGGANAQGAGLVAIFATLVTVEWGLVYPSLLIAFMTRPKVVAAFNPAPPPV